MEKRREGGFEAEIAAVIVDEDGELLVFVIIGFSEFWEVKAS